MEEISWNSLFLIKCCKKMESILSYVDCCAILILYFYSNRELSLSYIYTSITKEELYAIHLCPIF